MKTVVADTRRFGTFSGVFTPNVLTILGLILFLRIGWVVGQSGLWGALVIIAIANLISLLTGLSLSAIATNIEVKAGGNYYLISRSLGLEIGGAIGIPLYLSQAMSVAFYIIGFTETITAFEMFQSIDPRLISTVIVLLFVGIAYIGADFALKIQFGILAVLIASLVSFFLGGFGSGFTSEPVLSGNYTPGITFWAVFAVFFPAVTGIEVGTSLSGDLKNPSKSIPLGTIASIIVTAVIYFLVAIVLAFNGTPEQLLNDSLSMERIAIWPALIFAGVWASTLSSALGSVLAAPRTLQAVAYDAIVPRWLGNRLGSQTEPRVAVLVTGVIAGLTIWSGDLNAVAPIITMFFLNTYGMVNLAAGIEKLVGNPSFRPRFKIPWYVSILGAFGCYTAMFLINPVATVIAIVVSYGLYFVLQRRRIERTWGDVRSGIWFALARFSLLNLETQEQHVRNWRPNIMVFTGQPHNRQQLAEVASWLSQGQGIITLFQLLIGDATDDTKIRMRELARKHIRNFIDESSIKAFGEVDIVPDFKTGALTVIQAHGIGSLESNVVLLGWSENVSAQMHLMHDFSKIEKSVLLLKYSEEQGYGKRNQIDVWWQGRGGNADLMLLIAHLIQQHPTWQNAKIRLLRIAESPEAVTGITEYMNRLLASVRVVAEPIVIVRPDIDADVYTIVAEQSHQTDLTLVGMPLPDLGTLDTYATRLQQLADCMGTVLFVRNAEYDDDLLNVEG